MKKNKIKFRKNTKFKISKKKNNLSDHNPTTTQFGQMVEFSFMN